MEPVGRLKRLIDANKDRNARLQKSLEEIDEMGDRYAPDFKLARGNQVWKPKGYAFEGTVVAAFVTFQGHERYVVESRLSPGLLHIFNPDQIEKVEL